MRFRAKSRLDLDGLRLNTLGECLVVERGGAEARGRAAPAAPASAGQIELYLRAKQTCTGITSTQFASSFYGRGGALGRSRERMFEASISIDVMASFSGLHRGGH